MSCIAGGLKSPSDNNKMPFGLHKKMSSTVKRQSNKKFQDDRISRPSGFDSHRRSSGSQHSEGSALVEDHNEGG